MCSFESFDCVILSRHNAQCVISTLAPSYIKFLVDQRCRFTIVLQGRRPPKIIRRQNVCCFKWSRHSNVYVKGRSSTVQAKFCSNDQGRPNPTTSRCPNTSDEWRARNHSSSPIGRVRSILARVNPFEYLRCREYRQKLAFHRFLRQTNSV